VAAAKVFFWRQQEIHHQANDLAWSEVLPGLLVRLLSADADQFLEDVSHLHVVHTVRREVYSGESLDDLVEQVLLRHARDLLIKGKAIHDVAHVLGKAIDVGIKVGSELVGIVEQLGEIQLG
jgi:hypothetical protein